MSTKLHQTSKSVSYELSDSWGQRDSLACKVFTLHTTDLGSVPAPHIVSWVPQELFLHKARIMSWTMLSVAPQKEINKWSEPEADAWLNKLGWQPELKIFMLFHTLKWENNPSIWASHKRSQSCHTHRGDPDNLVPCAMHVPNWSWSPGLRSWDRGNKRLCSPK